jgi:hypothetical protein
MSCSIPLVTPRRVNFICRRFGTLCLFHLHRQRVPKHRHTKFTRQGIVHKKEHNIYEVAPNLFYFGSKNNRVEQSYLHAFTLSNTTECLVPKLKTENYISTLYFICKAWVSERQRRSSLLSYIHTP